MSAPRTLQCYEWIDHPAARVQALLHNDSLRIFSRATTGAAGREQALSVQLHLRLGQLDLSTEVSVEVGPIEDTTQTLFGARISTIPLAWSAASKPALFPHMRAKIYVYPLSNSVTQLEFEGSYTPPLGHLGEAIDAVIGFWVAEACVIHFMRDVAALLQEELAI